MSNKLIILVILSIDILSCKTNKNNQNVHYVFNESKAILLNDIVQLDSSNITNLDFSDSTMIGACPSFVSDDNAFYVYIPGTQAPVLKFDLNGKFDCQIGAIGHSDSEYTHILNISINSKKQSIDVLTNNFINEYKYDGTYIGKIKKKSYISTFAVDDKGEYWGYIGCKRPEIKGRLIRCDSNLKKQQEYLCDMQMSTPLFELNINKSQGLTLRESLNHTVYRIKDDSLEVAYTLEFPDHEFPDNIMCKDPIEIVQQLNSTPHARIKNYLENKDYSVFQIFYFSGLDTNPQKYYCIIDRKTNKDLIIKIPDDIPYESYLSSPEYLSADNNLYFIGYLVENGNQKIKDDINPSIVKFNIANLFD